MELFRVLFFLGVCLACFNLGNCTQPTGCSYDDTDQLGFYLCDYTAVTFPLTFTGFSPSPQRLKISKINGALASGSGTFSGFASYDTTTFNTNFAATLDLQCSTSSSISLTLSAGTFTGMGYLQRLTITNCYIDSLPSNVFADFGQIDSLIITGGKIGTIDSGAFTSLDIQPLSIVPNPVGMLEISNLEMPATTLTTGVFAPLVNITHIKLENIGLTAIQNSDFSSNTALRILTVPNNAFTTLSSGFFTGLNALAVVNVTGIVWDCSCTNLWFLPFAAENGIEFEGGVLCGSAGGYANYKAKADIYYNDLCNTGDHCNGNPGIVVGKSCIAAWDLAGYSILVLTLILSCIGLGLNFYTKRQHLSPGNKLKQGSSGNKPQKKRGKKPPQDSPRRSNGEGWV